MKSKLKTYFLVGFILLSYGFSFSQDQKLADSLIKIYESVSNNNDLELLKLISLMETNPEEQLYYAEKLIKKSLNDSLYNYLVSGYLQKGNAYQDLGKYTFALESFFISLKYAHKIDYDDGVGAINISIADVYSEMGNSTNAELYYGKGIEILRKENDSISLATALLNAGDEASNTRNFDKALLYFEESGVIFNKIDFLIGKAYNKGNVGMVYAELGRNQLAENNINQAINILEELEDYRAIAEYLTSMSSIYINKKDFPTAISYAQRSLDLSIKYNYLKLISKSNLQLSELYEAKGDTAKALPYFKAHIVYRDSIRNVDNVEKLAAIRNNSEIAQAETAKELAETRSRTQLIILGFTGLMLFTLLFFFRSIKKEKRKSDTLLLNILPEETADELKKHGKVKAKQYEEVSVLFTDFKGFTSYSEKLSPEELVKTIGFYFSKFDAIIEKYNLEKIKTIGDAYMCAGGIYHNKEDHAQRLVSAALDIAHFVEETKKNETMGSMNFDIRIGINSGPIVAGVVGTKKFAYDIWGDTVNVASRMESNGEVGRVNISEQTYALIKDYYSCEYRGEIVAKNRGKLKMYLVGTAKEISSTTTPTKVDFIPA